MLTINGTQYDLRFTLKRVEQIETATGKPLMADIQQNGGFLSLRSLKTYIAYGLIEAKEGAGHLSPQQGMSYAESLTEELDYGDLVGEVLMAIKRDCPFFFPAD